MTAPRIEVHVEELVLEGLPAAEGRGVVGEVERSLSGLLARRVRPRSAATSPWTIDGGAFELDREPVAAGVGVRVARSVHERLPR